MRLLEQTLHEPLYFLVVGSNGRRAGLLAKEVSAHSKIETGPIGRGGDQNRAPKRRSGGSTPSLN
jgi:hypothetical protein